MSLADVSPDCLARIVNHCQLSSADVANVRASCRALQHAVNAIVQAIQPTTGDAVAISVLLRKLPALTHLSLGHSCGVFSLVENYTQLDDYTAPLSSELSCHSSLTSLSLSASDLQHLGSLKWAHSLCADQQTGAAQVKPHNMSKWYKGEYTDFAADSNHQVYWLPDCFSSPPGLEKLVLQPPKCSSSHYSSLRTPACLWFNPKAWANKLKHLELHGIPVGARLPPGLSQLVQLHTVGLVGCSLQPEGLAQLLRHVAKGGIQLRSLVLRGNDLWQVPKEGWHILDGLQELDLSHNLLVDLPSGLSRCTSLTSLQLQHNQFNTVPLLLSTLQSLVLLDLSHNWLSGLSSTPHFGQLVASWRQLRTLRLANVSDKRGQLVLPEQLGECQRLTELSIGDNYDVDWASLEVLLNKLEGLHVLDLSNMAEGDVPATLKSKLESQKHKFRVVWSSA